MTIGRSIPRYGRIEVGQRVRFERLVGAPTTGNACSQWGRGGEVVTIRTEPLVETIRPCDSGALVTLRHADGRGELRADLKKHKAHIRMTNDIITNQCIAMQSALIDQHHKGHEAGMAWIGNTLFGPGLIPDIGEALALSKTDPAQAWFDAKMAEHEALRAKQDAAVGAA